VGLEGRAVRGIIKDFRTSAGQLIAEGRDNANLAVSHAGDELNVATRNVESALNGVLDKSFDKLDPTQRNMFARLNDMLSEAKSVRDSIAGVEDYASMDLEQRMGALPLVDARAFHLRRVDGLVLQKQELPYTLVIRGRGLGYDASRQYNVVVRVADQPVPLEMVQLSEYDARIFIKPELVNHLFLETAVAFLPVNIQATVTEHRWRGDKTASYSQDLRLILLPTKAARFTVSYTRRMKVRQSGRTKIETIVTPTATSQSPYTYQQTVRLTDTQYVTAVDFRGDGAGAGFCYHPAPPNWTIPEVVPARNVCTGGGPARSGRDPVCRTEPESVRQVIDPKAKYAPSHAVQGDRHSVMVSRKCDGLPAVLTWAVTYEEDVDTNVPGSLVGTTDAGFDQAFSFDVPNDVVDWTVTGKILDREAVSLKKGADSRWLKFVNETPAGDKTGITLKLTSPLQIP